MGKVRMQRRPAPVPAGRESRASAVLTGVAVTIIGAAALSGVSMAWGSVHGSDPEMPAGQSCPDDRPVKGNLASGGERIYHEPGWAYYAATTPESCFASAADARAAGFRPSKVQ